MFGWGLVGGGIITLACFVLVLIQLWKAEGTSRGLLGLLCSPYAFFWGWQNAKKIDATARTSGGTAIYENVMKVWTAALILQALISFFLR
jgi:hypothetical protein